MIFLIHETCYNIYSSKVFFIENTFFFIKFYTQSIFAVTKIFAVIRKYNYTNYMKLGILSLIFLLVQ